MHYVNLNYLGGIVLKHITRVYTCLLICTLIMSALVTTASAAEPKSGVVVVDDMLNVRNGPGLGYDIIDKLPNGQAVTINDTASGSGIIWYQITYSGSKNGYVSSDYIEIKEPPKPVEPNPDFEKYMDNQGFPESYKIKLRALHAQYPQWIFEAEHIVPNWQTVLLEESKTKVNMVHTNSDDALKSVAPDAYDETSGTWKGLDGATWVGASPEIIAYYLDPRNFLDERKIFQFVKHSFVADTQGAAKIKKMVKGSFLDANFPENGFDTYSDAIYHAGSRSGVSPYVLASMIIVEQGNNGIGGCISGTITGYEGYYNFLNIGAYASGGMGAVQRGLWWASGEGQGLTTYERPWNTRIKSLVGSATYYSRNYIGVGQDTLYLKKFDVIGDPLTGYYWHQYMANIEGAETEASKLRSAYLDIMDTDLVFKIPVYSGMPETLYPKVSGNGTVAPRLLREKIAKLPDNITDGDKAAVDILMNTYKSLTSTQKAMVSNYSKLKAAYDKIFKDVTGGDIDGDGNINLADIVMLRNWIMEGDHTAAQLEIGDLDHNGSINLADIVALRVIIMSN